MSLKVSEANKQGISRLITKCNIKFNTQHGTEANINPGDETRKILAEIGLNHAKEIIDVARKYAYYKTVEASKSISKGKELQKSKRFNQFKTETVIKIEPCDILNAISYLNLPLTRQIVYQFTTMKKTQTKQLNPLFTETKSD